MPDRGSYIYYLFFNNLDINNLSFTKQGKYFQNNFSIENINFVKGDCVSVLELLSSDYDLIVNPEGCKKEKFFQLIQEFRHKDKSLSLVAFKIDKVLFDKYKMDNQKLYECLESTGENRDKKFEECQILFPATK